MRKIVVVMSMAVLVLISVAFAQDKAFQGQTVIVVTQTGRAIGGPVEDYAPEWQEKTGGKIQLQQFAFGELFEKIITSFETGAGGYDVLIFPADWAGDFMAPGYVVPIPQEILDGIDVADVIPLYSERITAWGPTVYALPYDGDSHMMYYRKDLFAKYDIAVPKTWDEFVAASKTLKDNGVTPFTIGTKYLWTAAGWFDYMNLRVNGLDFHIDLMDGKVPYTDPRVKAVFAKWDELVKPGYYLDNHASYSWQEAQPFLYNGEAAMYLMGNFLAANFTDEVRPNMGFFQFPVIDPSVPKAEDAPMDTLHIPSKAKNKEDARKFLAFVAQPDIQTMINESLLQIPTNNKATPKDDEYLNAGVVMLNEAAGTAQFYDRDTDPSMAKEGMKGFQQYMVHPDRIDKILKKLEKTRQRTFKE